MIDLHSHSTASDGSFTPTELLRLASEKRLKALALTDHDTVDGLEEFMRAAPQFPRVEAVPGIELAACDDINPNHSFHIVGLYLGGDDSVLRELLADVIRWRQERNLAIVERLRSAGVPITVDLVRECAGHGVIGRPHIALALVKCGFANDVQNAFDRWIATGKPGYVRRRLPTPAEAIAAIHSMGGVAIWAHPFTRGNFSVAKIREFAVELKDVGLDGIEAYYVLHTPVQQRNVCDIARATGLMVSGGSDFHGDRFKRLDLGTGYGGLNVPDFLLEPIRSAALARKRHAASSEGGAYGT